jgi:mannitol/fructose-specific phosphotransferase system IIA component (Ntr-type)
MNLGDILTTQQIVPELKSANRWEAIDELIGVLVAGGKIAPAHREAVTTVVKKREQSMSTGIGFGIGIPHASTDLISEVVAAFGRSRAGVNFDALDNQPVHLVTLFLVPQGQFQKHLHTLAGIAKVLRKEEFLKALEDAADGEAIMGVIRQYSAQR